MKEFKDKSLSERLRTAEQAKQARLQRVRSMPGADDPKAIKQKAARQSIATAREARTEAKARTDHERSKRKAAEKVEGVALKQLEADREAAQGAEQKAARDARYAARKERKK